MRRPLQAARAFAPPPAPVPAPAADGAAPATPGAVMDINDILRILPHKYPFLMVDRVTRLEQNRIVGLKNVTINEPFFQGHFPGHPIMPGVLQLEAMAQLAGILALKLGENLGKVAYFMSADGVKWRKPVLPGDVLEIDFELLRTRGKIIRGRGQCRVAGEVVSEGEISFILVDPNEPAR
jgi:UDP-3-O-[3-hydroxymyristoyl] N-acetylglucosamine deacetylase/3-hydroxyacyl-[acyl-carrier-protein] dehydratase